MKLNSQIYPEKPSFEGKKDSFSLHKRYLNRTEVSQVNKSPSVSNTSSISKIERNKIKGIDFSNLRSRFSRNDFLPSYMSNIFHRASLNSISNQMIKNNNYREIDFYLPKPSFTMIKIPFRQKQKRANEIQIYRSKVLGLKKYGIDIDKI